LPLNIFCKQCFPQTYFCPLFYYFLLILIQTVYHLIDCLFKLIKFKSSCPVCTISYQCFSKSPLIL
jgi:hypothetical protein